MSKEEFRQIYFYEFKLGHSAAQTARNINEVWGQGSINESTVQRWFQTFHHGDFSLENKDGRGRPSGIDNDLLKTLVEENSRATVFRELAKDLGAISEHLNQIGKSKKLDKWVPHELNENQKNRRYEICSSLLLRNRNVPFLDCIVTCDEKWILYDNRRRSAQWLGRSEPPKQFPKRLLHQKKVMVTVWWTAAGLIHHNFLNPGETITAETYCKEIDEMHAKLRQMSPALVNRKGPILLHDNARPHVARSTLQKLNELGYETLPHPAYSPDLSPTDFHFFKHLEIFLQGKVFKDQTAAKNAFEEFIVSRSSEFYATGINKLVSHWQKCVDSDGSYFN